jgi:hypothetical protein
MHLNRACAYPDLSNLFTRADVTERAHDALEAMPGVIQDQLAMLAGPLPNVAIGDGATASLELERLLFQEAELAAEAKAQSCGPS